MTKPKLLGVYKKVIIHNFTYKFNNRENKSLMTEIRMVVALAGSKDK